MGAEDGGRGVGVHYRTVKEEQYTSGAGGWRGILQQETWLVVTVKYQYEDKWWGVRKSCSICWSSFHSDKMLFIVTEHTHAHTHAHTHTKNNEDWLTCTLPVSCMSRVKGCILVCRWLWGETEKVSWVFKSSVFPRSWRNDTNVAVTFRRLVDFQQWHELLNILEILESNTQHELPPPSELKTLWMTTPSVYVSFPFFSKYNMTLVQNIPIPCVITKFNVDLKVVVSVSSILTGLAVLSRPAVHTSSLSRLVAHVMAKVVVAWTAHRVAPGAVVVFVAAHSDGVSNGGDQAFMFHRLPLLSGVNFSFVDAALNQKLLVFTETNGRHFLNVWHKIKVTGLFHASSN